jgi:hypothetical protein
MSQTLIASFCFSVSQGDKQVNCGHLVTILRLFACRKDTITCSADALPVLQHKLCGRRSGAQSVALNDINNGSQADDAAQ